MKKWLNDLYKVLLNRGLNTLDNVLENYETQIKNRYTKNETDALLNTKQNNLTTTQMNTVNSGLTSSDKTTLDDLSYTANIVIPINEDSGLSGTCTMTATRKGNLVQLTFNGTFNPTTVEDNYSAFILPNEFRPHSQRQFNIFVHNTGALVRMTIYENGSVVINQRALNFNWGIAYNTLIYLI